MGYVRPAIMAGSWYPGTKEELAILLEELFSRADPGEQPAPRALVAPHAGYVYSGLAAAHAYKTLMNRRYDTVVVVSPSHREAFAGVSFFDGEAYSTPLGRVPVAGELVRELAAAAPRFHLGRTGHREEHALELQLPFLQKALREFELVPVVMGDQSLETAEALGKAVARVCGENCLLVASSDLSHFHHQEAALELDGLFIRLFEAGDFRELAAALAAGRTEACGGGPVLAAMVYNRECGGTRQKTLIHYTSARVTGDSSNVVGYLAGLLA